MHFLPSSCQTGVVWINVIISVIREGGAVTIIDTFHTRCTFGGCYCKLEIILGMSFVVWTQPRFFHDKRNSTEFEQKVTGLLPLIACILYNGYYIDNAISCINEYFFRKQVIMLSSLEYEFKKWNCLFRVNSLISGGFVSYTKLPRFLSYDLNNIIILS